MDMTENQVRVLLVTSARDKKWLDTLEDKSAQKLQDFSKAIVSQNAGVELLVTSLDQLHFSVVGGVPSIIDLKTNTDIKEFDAVHLRGVGRDIIYYTDFAKAIELYVLHHGKKVVDPQDVGAPFGKLAQAMLFALNGIPAPDTWSRWNGDDLATHQFAFPVIAKATMGTMGADNYLVEDAQSLTQILADIKEPFIIQNVIPNDGDYRVLLLGDAEPLVFWRPKIAGSHLSNTSQGSVPSIEESLDADVLALARKVQAVSQRVVVGVDIMQNNETGGWIVLEANNNAALATGAFTDEKANRYAQMIHQIVKKEEV